MNFHFCESVCCTFLRVSPLWIGRRWFYKDNRPRKPRNGKFHGYAIKYQNVDHFALSLKRGFTRATIKEFGLETGLEDMKILIENRSQNIFRRLNDKKKKQLIAIYTEQLSSIFSMDENISKSKILITKVELPLVLNEVLIYWKCFGDERDEEMVQLLDLSALDVTQKLSDYFGKSILKLRFMPDRSHLYREEMDQLFELADYGKQYRTVSPIGAVLGSTKETGLESAEEKFKKVPRWLKERMEYNPKKLSDVNTTEHLLNKNSENGSKT